MELSQLKNSFQKKITWAEQLIELPFCTIFEMSVCAMDFCLANIFLDLRCRVCVRCRHLAKQNETPRNQYWTFRLSNREENRQKYLIRN